MEQDVGNHSQWIHCIERFLQSLTAVQAEQFALYARRYTALVTGNLPELLACQTEEEKIVAQLQNLTKIRMQILRGANQDQLPGELLSEVVGSLGIEAKFLLEEIQNVEKRSASLREESWVQWILVNRKYEYNQDVISLIAHQGEKPLTYSDEDANHVSGGAFLDVST